MELLFLGTGTSAGVPMIGCDCRVCRSNDPRDQRSRASVLIRYPDPDPEIEMARQFLIDTTPEMRLQVIRHGIKRLDGVMYTHAHADHVFGLDDLRRFNAVMSTPINLYAERETLQTLERMFWYIFEPHRNINKSFIARLNAIELHVGRPLQLFGANWTPLRLLHGRLPIIGFHVEYRGQKLAYCTDVSSFPPESYPLLHDLDVLVIDALRYRHHPTHMTVDQALAVIDHVQPRRAYFTHIAHDIEHADLESKLPEHVFLAFDGLSVRCAGEQSPTV